MPGLISAWSRHPSAIISTSWFLVWSWNSGSHGAHFRSEPATGSEKFMRGTDAIICSSLLLRFQILEVWEVKHIVSKKSTEDKQTNDPSRVFGRDCLWKIRIQ